MYGKQDWRTFERGEENCYLMTNGLGGFSSLSMIGSCSRNDQAVLMACLHSPNHRYNMVHRLEEVLTKGETVLHLSSQDDQCHEKRESGYLYQIRFSYEDYPQWAYLVDGVEIIRTIAMMQGKNTVGVTYEIRNRSDEPVTLRVFPHLQFVPKGVRMSRNQSFTFEEVSPRQNAFSEAARNVTAGSSSVGENPQSVVRISSNGQHLYFRTNGTWEKTIPRFCETLYYAFDARDGKMELGRTAVGHVVSYTVGAGRMDTLEIIYGLDANSPSMPEILAGLKAYRRYWRERAGLQDETARDLCAAASQFISYRASTARQTILAGFPFFEDWGRDTMIALLGCCLSTRQFHVAESILRTFMIYCRKGLMPNLFPEGKDAPGYNTVDAALLFIIAVYEYFCRTQDRVFVESAYPVMADIIDWYEKGTDYGIHMDADGLIMAGQGLDQVTWMDVRVGEILPTPRHGKPVEINAYWYNALRIMDLFGREYPENNKNYGVMAQRAAESFRRLFWNEEVGALRDVISEAANGNHVRITGSAAEDIGAFGGSGAFPGPDDQIRCNQIWAVSLPFSILSPVQEKAVVETVFRKLYTPYGLRTLDPADRQFRPFYGGAQLDRDLAYHQGTVWTFPLGGYYLAYLKVSGYSDEAKQYVRQQLRSIEAALREGCVGQLPEIYDGQNPISSKGCFAQAWSVGEILRVYECLENH